MSIGMGCFISNYNRYVFMCVIKPPRTYSLNTFSAPYMTLLFTTTLTLCFQCLRFSHYRTSSLHPLACISHSPFTSVKHQFADLNSLPSVLITDKMILLLILVILCINTHFIISMNCIFFFIT